MLRRWSDVWNDFDQTLAWMEGVRRQMDRTFSGPALGLDLRASRGFPCTNLVDEGNEYILRAEVPGLSEKDIKVTVHQDVLTLSGARESEAPEGYTTHRRERQPLRFSRSFSFPSRVDLEKVKASVKNGVLTVHLAKVEEAQPRQIAVTTE
ncbi:MAG TPA: Hsp20/alpha crystallin family protein [Polyangiaceae bacterium]|nr:MAG: Spore protein SP21 [Deltaproteobacteria bacterium ADurb.Bin207]HNS99193.1 Hsp20/alpha crystallin family protein [Polyangiaceae bacterium]HNZ20952.1 Hsp20/alpha crystallin family protein [Polyangiaceae bacterium]HOD24019.1 Hsp20/alpha crystallin family protein [Polyangiaceae bacterium]HOE51933.1 Hsp20/alpha crystallin family protein [Polyangiaceae bacterium]